MSKRMDEKTIASLQQAQQSTSEMITEADLGPLPEPVQRYLRHAQVVNKLRIKCAKVRQAGFMRMSPTQNWMKVDAVQYTTLLGSLSRTWYARAKIGGINLLTGYDRYADGEGHMLMRLLSLFPVVDARGPEMDMSAVITYVNDMVMWPTAFLSDYIQWNPIDENSARAIVNLYGKQFSAILRFNAAGEMIDFITEDRYRLVGKESFQTKWSTPFRGYHLVNGMNIPSEGEAIWHLPEGDFSYFRVSIGEIQYDTFSFD